MEKPSIKRNCMKIVKCSGTIYGFHMGHPVSFNDVRYKSGNLCAQKVFV